MAKEIKEEVFVNYHFTWQIGILTIEMCYNLTFHQNFANFLLCFKDIYTISYDINFTKSFPWFSLSLLN